MTPHHDTDAYIDQQVTYVIDLHGTLMVIANVPARVHQETGERFFAPTTVAKIQEIIQSARPPAKIVHAPVFEFAA